MKPPTGKDKVAANQARMNSLLKIPGSESKHPLVVSSVKTNKRDMNEGSEEK